MRAEFCIFESNAPGLKANFHEPYVDKPTPEPCNFFFPRWKDLLIQNQTKGENNGKDIEGKKNKEE